MKKKITDYSISICHPSYGRPIMGVNTAKKWLEMAKYPDRIEYIMCLSEKENEENIQSYFYNLVEHINPIYPEKTPPIKIIYCKEASLVAQTNEAAKHSTGDLIINVSDDSRCFQDWDIALLEGIEKEANRRNIESFFTVKTKDGIQPFLITMPIMDREWYNRFGYVFYPEYQHMHVDDDLSMVSHRLDRTLYVDLLFEHLHYTKGKMEKDETNEKNDSTYSQGATIYGIRGGNNFGLKPNEIINKDNPDIYTADFFNK